MQIKVYTIDVKLPQWLKRTLAYVAIPGAVFFGVIAVVYAATWTDPATSIAANKPVSASVIRDNFIYLKDASSALDTRLKSAESKLSSYMVTVSSGGDARAIPANSYAWVTSGLCPAGYYVVSGGCNANGGYTGSSLVLQTSAIAGSSQAWTCMYYNPGSATTYASVPQAYCLPFPHSGF